LTPHHPGEHEQSKYKVGFLGGRLERLWSLIDRQLSPREG
jgi:hypothetical protein